jgi:hypothetical protein
MDDQDDPEKRIAELERQLAERSPIVELGHQGATVTTSPQTPAAPPQSPTPTASPPYGASTRSPDGTAGGGADFLQFKGRPPWRRWHLVWILAIFWLVIPLANGLGLVLSHLRQHSSSSSGMNSRTVPPTVASFRTQPSPSGMSVGPGGVLSASGNAETRTIACNEGTLQLSGNSNTFTVTGHCRNVEVSGNYTHVTVDSADSIDAGGIYTVTVYHWGTPKITESGIGVTVNQG